MNMYVTELMGTFFLTLVVALTTDHPLAPLAIGGVLAAMVYAGGYISGAHYNPAVTITAALSRALGKANLKAMIVAQLIGATGASLIANGLTGKVFSPTPAAPILFAPFVAEVLFTMALCYVILHATASSAKGNQYFGFAIGATLLVAAIAAGPISGAVLNPAIGTGAYIAGLLSGGTMSLSSLVLYITAPITGAVLAASVFGMQKNS